MSEEKQSKPVGEPPQTEQQEDQSSQTYRRWGGEPRVYKTPRPWFERWEYNDALRTPMRFNPNVNRAIRLKSARTLFNERYWPDKDPSVWEQWEQAQIFFGLMMIIPVWHTREQHEAELAAQAAEDATPDFSDDSDFEEQLPKFKVSGINNEDDGDDTKFRIPQEHDDKVDSNALPADIKAGAVDLSIQTDVSQGFRDGAPGVYSRDWGFRGGARGRGIPHGRGTTFRGRGSRGRGAQRGRGFGKVKQLKTRPPYDAYGVESPPIVDSQDEIEALFKQAEEEMEDRLMLFMNDPARRVTLYLGSYMRKECLNLTERNLHTVPLLLKFFIKFILKHNVFSWEAEERESGSSPRSPSAPHSIDHSAELDITANLQLALHIIEIAIEQLPLVSEATKALTSESFGTVCGNIFGLDRFALELTAHEQDKRSENQAQQDCPGHLEDITAPSPTISSPPSPLSLQTTAEDASDDDDCDQVTSISSSVEGCPPDTDGVFALETVGDGVYLDPAAWSSVNRTRSIESSFGLPILTALPQTHELGVVERSMRRIREIVPPAQLETTTQDNDSSDLSQTAMETQLDAKFVEHTFSTKLTKIILDPWLGWEKKQDEPDLAEPEILRGSATADIRNLKEKSEKAKGLLEYDPFHDSITLLIEPECASALRVGMGMGATWVQMVRRYVELGPPAFEGDISQEQFWYLADLKAVVPSYYIAE